MKTAIIALSLLVAAGIAVSAAAGKTTARTLTWHLVEKDAGFNFVDNPPRQGDNAPPLIGDQFVFTNELRTKSGQHAGWLNAMCTVSTGGTHAAGPCYGGFSFAGGTILGMTIANFASDKQEITIVGGTGVYRGASGWVESINRPNTPYSDDTFHIVLP